MSKIIRITEFTPTSGSEYNFSAYPKAGNYLLPSGVLACAINGCVYTLPGGCFTIENEPEPVASPAQHSGVSEKTLLKTIAICLRPDAHTARDVA